MTFWQVFSIFAVGTLVGFSWREIVQRETKR